MLGRFTLHTYIHANRQGQDAAVQTTGSIPGQVI